MPVSTQNLNIFIHTVHRSELKLTAGSHINNQELFKAQLNEYPERALLLSTSSDYIVLNHYPDESYLDYLVSLGIGTHNILLPTVTGESLSERLLNDKQLLNLLRNLGKSANELTIQPYISTQAERQIAELINASVNGSPPELTSQVNNKIYLPALLQELSLPCIEYEIVDTTTVMSTAQKLMSKYTKIIIIGEHTYGGIAVWKLTDNQTLSHFKRVISQCQSSERFLVGKMYEVSSSPNIQYNISLDCIQKLGITEQILDANLKHQGNVSLSTRRIAKLNQYSQLISAKLQGKGYRGLVGIDFIETVDGNIFAVDINGRANASSFGLNAIHKLFPDTNQQKHFKILPRLDLGKKLTFPELRNLLGKNNLFTKQNEQGILPYNTGFLKWGKLSAIIVADTLEDINKWHSMFPLRRLR